LGKKWPVNLACDSEFHVNRRDLLHAANLRHGAGGFTFPPKEGMLWIFSPEKSNGFNAAGLSALSCIQCEGCSKIPLHHGAGNIQFRVQSAWLQTVNSHMAICHGRRKKTAR
jgi:hypothetical protein